MLRVFIIPAMFFLASQALSGTSTYYPEEFLDEMASKTDIELKELIHKTLKSPHQPQEGLQDKLGCTTGSNGCYKREVLSYKQARKKLFGQLHLRKDGSGFFVEEVYCLKKITKRQTSVGPNKIPNANIVNAEHTWPQSRFSSRFSKNSQKTDLHHLFPTDSSANSTRGNFEFTHVTPDMEKEVRNCNDKSVREQGSNRFMPPENHRGNVARALFYFSILYKVSISKNEENALRLWAEEDPVDEEEMTRNEDIFKIQKNRNPFIDFPELYQKISDF